MGGPAAGARSLDPGAPGGRAPPPRHGGLPLTVELEPLARRWAYESDRPDVRPLVPRSARRILDAGCSTGAVGAALKAEQGAEVVGIELDGEAAALARGRLDHVLQADLDALPEDLEQRLGRFDCLLCADVLEHLRDPDTALRRLVALLEPGATVVVSLPNVRHWTTFWHLGWEGRWPRHAYGVFDRTHLRWFTELDARDLLEAAGLRLAGSAPIYRMGSERSRLDPWLRWLASTPLRQLVTFQHVLVARAC